MTTPRIISSRFKKTLFAASIVALVSAPCVYADDDDDDGEREITFIHTGDFHGDFHSHVNVRDGQASEGGLARVATVIKKIRANSENSFYVHTGDTIQGSGQVLLTRGQAMIDVVNLLGIDAFAPGNWEHTYGLGRFRELFLGTPDDPATPANEYVRPQAPWGITAVNSYYNGEAGNTSGTFADPAAPYPASITGNRVVNPYNGKPYRVVRIGGVKVGIFGCTTNRGPQIVGANVTAGVTFSNCKGQISSANNKAIAWPAAGHENQDPLNPGGFNTVPEIPKYVDILRNQEKVDVVILLSEAGLAENIYNAETYNGIDIIFSSDMHEETNYPVQVMTPNGGKALIIEEGEDGAQVGELKLTLKNGKVSAWKWKEHDVTTQDEDRRVAAKIKNVLAKFEGETFDPTNLVNPFNGTKPYAPLDEVIGYTDVALSRNNYAHMWDPANGVMPGVIEGTAHSLITDAFRVVTNALLPTTQKTLNDGVNGGNITTAPDGKYIIGAIRGFRYVNSYPAGSPITYEDLYHFLSIGPQVAVTDLTAGALNNQTESAADSCMNPDVTKWAGGWFFNFSGVTMDMNPYGARKRIDAPDLAKINDPAGHTAKFTLGRTSLSDDATGDWLTDGTEIVSVAADGTKTYAPNETGKRYRYASYYYDGTPTQVNNIPPAPIVKDANGVITVNNSIRKIMRVKGSTPETLANLALVQVWPTYAADYASYENVDAVEIVALYIKQFLGGRIDAVELPFPRINMTAALPDTRPRLGFPTVEPVWGARLPGTAAYNSTYGRVNYLPSQYNQD